MKSRHTSFEGYGLRATDSGDGRADRSVLVLVRRVTGGSQGLAAARGVRTSMVTTAAHQGRLQDSTLGTGEL